MAIFGLTFERHYPVFGFDDGYRAMTADEILRMQGEQALAMQNSYVAYSLGSLSAMMNYRLPQRPLDERFAEFKVRLAAALKKHGVAA